MGDACHPMRPHMAQGAAMALEDAAILSRCIQQEGIGRIERAFATYAANRVERLSRVHRISTENSWLREAVNPEWVFSYDATEAGLSAPVSMAV